MMGTQQEKLQGIVELEYTVRKQTCLMIDNSGRVPALYSESCMILRGNHPSCHREFPVTSTEAQYPVLVLAESSRKLY